MAEPRIWVLVADSDTARLYCGDGSMARLRPALTRELTALDFLPASSPVPVFSGFDEADIWNDAEDGLGIGDASAGGGLSIPFPDQLARLLREGAFDDAYDGLIIAAVPRLMGRLDRALSAETRARLMGCVVDDLMHLGPAGLCAYLRAHVFH
jgi:protein required for attachment to host cells